MSIGSCSVCQEEMNFNLKISACPCGHVFHSTCIDNWYARSQSCPECRMTINDKNPIRILRFNKFTKSKSSKEETKDISKLDTNDLLIKFIDLHSRKNTLAKQLKILDSNLKDKISKINDSVIHLRKQLSDLDALKDQADEATKSHAQYQKILLTNNDLNNKLKLFDFLNKSLNVKTSTIVFVVAKSIEDLSNLLSTGTCSKQSCKESKDMCRILFRQLTQIKRTKPTAVFSNSIIKTPTPIIRKRIIQKTKDPINDILNNTSCEWLDDKHSQSILNENKEMLSDKPVRLFFNKASKLKEFDGMGGRTLFKRRHFS